jgi:hypothetical protein
LVRAARRTIRTVRRNDVASGITCRENALVFIRATVMRRSVTPFLVIALLLAPVTAMRAQAPVSERDAVKRAVLDYVEGFYEGDSTRFVRSIRPEVFKYGFWIPRDSTKYQCERMPWAEFHSYANRVKANKRFAPASAPKEITVFDVLDQTASAKLVAYWGVDYLLLAKYDGRWMITHVLWQTPPKL